MCGAKTEEWENAEKKHKTVIGTIQYANVGKLRQHNKLKMLCT